jgi:hypothetical protein
MKALSYYLNKYYYYPPYKLWLINYRITNWIGNNIGYKGMNYLERYEHMNKLKNILGEAINDSHTINSK